MKNLMIPALLILSFAFSCSPATKEDKEVALGDTIQTESGLQYIYVTKGEGRKVESGSEVSAYLSLKVNDNVIWTTDSSPDSVFTFITDYSRVIRGFNEVTKLLREGDEVIAILPDSLAYGSRGSGALVPPNSTLVYDIFRVVSVSEPKMAVMDTLFNATEKGGLEGMMARHQEIINGPDSANYHMGIDQIYDLWQKMSMNNMHIEALNMVNYFVPRFPPDMGLRWYRVRSMEELGLIEVAIDTLQNMIAQDTSNISVLQDKLMELEIKLAGSQE